MERIREVIIVEGKYDAIRLHTVVDATVIETAGFGIFRDPEQVELLRLLAERRGLLVLTDSDGAGFVIRNYLNSVLPKTNIKHAYIPEIAGKERRKTTASQEGLLGVEGMDTAILLEALRRGGATFEGENAPPCGCRLTKANLYDAGLVGTAHSAQRRRRLQAALGLPQKLSANRLLELLNTAYSPTEYEKALRETENLP